MAQVAIGYIAKAVVGFAVGKIVGKITGNELLGALAGGFVGAGFNFNPTTGAMGWNNPLSGLTTGSGAAGAGVQSASLGVGDAANLLDTGPAITGMTPEAIAASNASVAASSAGGAIAPDVTASYGFSADGNSLVQGGAATQPGAGGMLSSAFDTAGNFINDNPMLAQFGFDAVSGAMTPDRIDEINELGDEQRKTLQKKQDLKEAVDPDAVRGLLSQVNQNVYEGGYRPAISKVNLADFNPIYSKEDDPNLVNRVAGIYETPTDENVKRRPHNMGMLNEMMGNQQVPEGQPSPQGQPPQGGGNVQALIKKATELLYGDNFEAMVQMFQQHGKQGFPQAMATAVNGVLDRLEKETGGPLDAETAAQIGVALFEMLLQDLSEGGVLPDIDKQAVLMSIEAILQQWAKAHPDQANPEEMKQIIGQLAQQMGASGAVQTPSEMVAGGGQPPQGQPPEGQPPQGQPPQGV